MMTTQLFVLSWEIDRECGRSMKKIAKYKKEHEMKRKLAYQKSTAARSEYYVS